MQPSDPSTDESQTDESMGIAATPAETTDSMQQAIGGVNSPVPVAPSRPSLAIASLLVVILLAVGAGYHYMSARNDPNKPFTDALSKALSTKNFTQVLSSTDSDTKLTIRYNVQDPKNAAVAVAGKIFVGSNNIFTYDGYGNFQNTYLKFSRYEDPSKTIPSTVLNTWVRVRHDGTDPTSGYSGAIFQNDPTIAFFGDLFFGNFSTHDRQDILHFISQHHVYTATPGTSRKTTLDGESVYVYKVHEDATGIKDLNKHVADLLGMSVEAKAEQSLVTQYAGDAEIYVNTASGEFTGIKTRQSQVAYGDYGTTKVGSPPTGAMTWGAFSKIIDPNTKYLPTD